MSGFGFSIYNAAGQEVLSSDSYGFAFVDHFTVAPTDSGSRRYAQMSDVPVKVIQTQQEPAAASKATLLSLSCMNTWTTTDGADLLVHWSPRFVVGSGQSVAIYVLGL